MNGPGVARTAMASQRARQDTLPASPVRVMHVVHRLQAGGMEYGVIKLVNGLDRQAVQSSICSTTPATAVKDLLRPDVTLFECRRREGNDPRLVLALARVFRRARPHIVHTHSWGTLCEGLLAARLARVPAVVHGEHGTLQLGPLQRRVQRLAWRRVDRVLSVSSRLTDRMAEAIGFPRDRITTICNGVDTSRFGRLSRPDARKALGWDPDRIMVGTVGRLVAVKDHSTLIAAAAILRDGGCRVGVVIAGDGPLQAELESKIDGLNLRESVRLLGHRPDPETILAALDVFVLPSRSEGMSNTILEAMASGLPVVATAVGGNVELVETGTTGLLVPPGDPGVLASGLRELLGSPERRETIGAAGSRRARECFSLDAMIRAYEGVYLQTIAPARHPSGVRP